MSPLKRSSPAWEPSSKGSGRTDPGWFSRPLVPLAAAFIAGILLGRLTPGNELTALCILGASLALSGFLALRRREDARRIGVVLAFFLLGILFLGPYKPLEFSPGHIAGFADGSKVGISGVVNGPIQNRPECLRFVMEAEGVSLNGKTYPAKGNVRVSAYEVRPSVKPGDRISFVTRLRRIQSFKNPGSFDYASHMADKDIFVAATIGKKSQPVVYRGASGQEGLFSRIRRDITGEIGRAAPGEGGDVLAALVTGDTSRISGGLRQVFADAGTSHLLAVSGLHVGLAAGFAYFVFNWLLSFFPGLVNIGASRRIALLLSVAPAILYGLLTGMSPSTQRAVIMVTVFFLSFSVKRQGDTLNTLAAAALAILAISPESLFDISFQLSFLSVLFIILGVRITPFISSKPREEERLRLWLYRLASLAAMTVFATLATLPLVLRAFHQVSVSGFAANFILVPLVGAAVLPVGLSGAVILPFWPGLASWLFSLAGFLMEWGVYAIRWFANLPISAIMPVFPSVFEAALYYLLIACVAGFRRSALLKAGLFAVLLAFACDGLYWRNARFSDEMLRVTVLDVGQGTSVVVRFPKGPVMLADAGGLTGESSLDIGKAVVAPYLWSQKIHTVDVAALTHPDQDHAGGMPFILDRFNVRKFWYNGQNVETETYNKIMEILTYRKIARKTHQELFAGFKINGVSVKCLYPPPDIVPPKGKQTNKFSMVLQLKMGEKSILIPGDVTKPGLKAIMKAIDPKELDCTVLVIPHHGAKTSFLQEFADAARPRWAIVSVGQNNPWKLPRNDVLAAYRKNGAEIFRTDRDGAVFIETDGAKTEVSSFVSQ